MTQECLQCLPFINPLCSFYTCSTMFIWCWTFVWFHCKILSLFLCEAFALCDVFSKHCLCMKLFSKPCLCMKIYIFLKFCFFMKIIFIFVHLLRMTTTLHMIIIIIILFCILCCFSWIMKDYHMLMDIEDYSTIAIRFCFIDLVIANSVFSNWYASFFRFIAKFDQCNQHSGCHYISMHIIIALFAAWVVVCKP